MAFDVLAHREWAWRKLKQIAARGADGRIKAGEAPGYAVGVRALSLFVNRTDPEGARVGDGPRILAVQVVVTGGAAGALEPGTGADPPAGLLPPRRVAVSLAGDGAGHNGGAPPAE